MLFTLGLLPKHLRRFPKNLFTIALLPKFLSRKHPDASDTKHAHFKRVMTWASVNRALQDLVIDAAEGGEGGTGYRWVNNQLLFMTTIPLNLMFALIHARCC